MGATSIGSFSVPIGPGAFCLICHLRGGALSVSPFRTLTGAYQSSLVAFATGDDYEIRTLYFELERLASSPLDEIAIFVSIKSMRTFALPTV